jgi:hypothetical protein
MTKVVLGIHACFSLYVLAFELIACVVMIKRFSFIHHGFFVTYKLISGLLRKEV